MGLWGDCEPLAVDVGGVERVALHAERCLSRRSAFKSPDRGWVRFLSASRTSRASPVLRILDPLKNHGFRSVMSAGVSLHFATRDVRGIVGCLATVRRVFLLRLPDSYNFSAILRSSNFWILPVEVLGSS